METQWTIGKVAKKARVNIQTVRFYERRGLVSPDGHRDSGYRLYEPEAARKIRFIKNAQELGFSLKEIDGLLRLRVGRRVQCASVKKKAVIMAHPGQARTDELIEAVKKAGSYDAKIKFSKSCPSLSKTLVMRFMCATALNLSALIYAGISRKRARRIFPTKSGKASKKAAATARGTIPREPVAWAMWPTPLKRLKPS